MPKADTEHTTAPPDTPSNRSRRGLLTGSTAALLAGAAIAMVAPAAVTASPGGAGGDDAELIALAADYAAAVKEIRRLGALDDAVPDEAFEPLDDRRYAAIERATELAAVTAAGLRAKASILVGEVDLYYAGLPDLDRRELLAHSLGRDVVGRAAA